MDNTEDSAEEKEVGLGRQRLGMCRLVRGSVAGIQATFCPWQAATSRQETAGEPREGLSRRLSMAGSKCSADSPADERAHRHSAPCYLLLRFASAGPVPVAGATASLGPVSCTFGGGRRRVGSWQRCRLGGAGPTRGCC